MRTCLIAVTILSLLGSVALAASTSQPQKQPPRESAKQSPRQPHARPLLLPDLLAAASCTTEEQPHVRQVLVVVIRNIGTALAGASITKVEFTSGSGQRVFELKTHALWPGGSYEHLVTIPSGCFDPDCGFSITVDPGNSVRESNEVNNASHQNCLG